MSKVRINGPYEETKGNIFEAIGFEEPEAGELLMRAQLMVALKKWRKAQNLTQAAAAKVLGVDQARISEIERGKFNNFSLDTLVRYAFLAGLKPELRLAA